MLSSINLKERLIRFATTIIPYKSGIDAIIVAGDKFDEDHINFDNFEVFNTILIDELVPLIDSTYKNNNNSRTLLGRGTGATHSLLTMLMETTDRTTFYNYIVTDPPGTLVEDTFLVGIIYIFEE